MGFAVPGCGRRQSGADGKTAPWESSECGRRPQSSGGSYGKSSGSGYGSAPSSDYGESMPHSGGSSFAELDDDDGELPF